MPENDPDKDEATPPHVELVQMASAHFVSHIVYAAAKIGERSALADDLSYRKNSEAWDTVLL
jgi:hypothetical protein